MAYDLHWSKRQPVKKNIFLILSVVSFVLFLVVDRAGPATDTNNIWAGLKYFFLLYSILCVVFHVWWYRTYAKRMAKKMNIFGKEFTFTFSSKGIKVTSEKATGDILWSDYPSSIINDQIILLYKNNVQFIYYPRRFFTMEEYRAIKDWIKDNVKVVE
ncbi:MAG: hypothetical protein JWO06_864 [Bacteroidota bacterium]|nr:hypothetical protein [Bacteroidota bacterium]